jgi:uncharacterized alkaline shock family protein YloU
MGIFGRIILSVYTLLLIFLSVGVIMMGFRLIPLELVGTSITYIYGQWEAGVVGIAFLFASIPLLWAGLRRKGRKNIIHHNDMGDVYVSLDAVENLVEKAARHVRGVRNIKVSAEHTSLGLKLYMKTIISPESFVPDVTAQVQERVNEYIKNTVGVELAEMRIFVENISNDFKARQRVE